MLIELKKGALLMLEYSWPMLVIAVIVAIVLRLGFAYKNNIKLIFHEELFKLLFIIYILCLFHIVTFQDVSWASTNFVPFKEIFRYTIGSSLFYRNIFGNILLFLPFGIFASKFLEINKYTYIIFLSLIVSLTIESIQLIIGRVFDIDDIILNVTGGLFGYIIYSFFKNIGIKVPKVLKQDWILDIIYIILIGGIICFLIP